MWLAIGRAGTEAAQAAPSTQSVAAATRPSTQPASALPAADPTDGNAFPVSQFILSYTTPDAQLPPVSELMKLSVDLGQVRDGFVVPPAMERKWLSLQGGQVAAPKDVASRATRRLVLGEVSASPRSFYTSALWAIDQQITQYLNAHDIVGVYVQPDPNQIKQVGRGEDARPATDTTLRLIIHTGSVRSLRTVASGGRIDQANVINSPKHAWIRENSPVQPVGSAKPGTTSLLRRDLLDDYIDFLNRHPGRHVDAAISAASLTEPDAIALDYLVNEPKPWTLYAQVSNTGTAETEPWRERFGFIDNQLTNHDDILTLDYSTAGFTKSNDVIGSYDFPISPNRRLRARVYGSYDQFTASDVGFGRERFDGLQYSGGGELALNVFQHRDWFVDLVAGGRYEHDRITNNTPGVNTSGTANFGIPYGGARLEHSSEIHTLLTDLMLLGRFTGASKSELNSLGRINTDQSALLLQADLNDTFFIEPLINPGAFTAGKSTLAHEMYLSGRAQYAFDHDRVIPAAEQVAGGMFSVRGYPESISAGDTVIVGTVEYRFHLPRVLAVSGPSTNFKPFGQPFKFAPPQVYGRPDWDLILRGFLDAGQTINNSRESFEQDATLVGTGVGIEFDFRNYVSLRLDWGVALSAIPHEVDAGSNRFYFAGTFSY